MTAEVKEEILIFGPSMAGRWDFRLLFVFQVHLFFYLDMEYGGEVRFLCFICER